MNKVRSIDGLGPQRSAQRRKQRSATDVCQAELLQGQGRLDARGRIVAVVARLIGLGFLCSAAGSALAQAQPDVDGPYVGGNVGWLRAGEMSDGAVNEALQGQGLGVRTSSVDDRATGWKLFAGYRFDRYWAIEGGYTSLGRYGFQGQVIADPGTVDANWRAGDWNLFAVANLPLGDRFEIFGKAGAGWWRTRLQATGTFSGRGVLSADANGVGAIGGLGVRFRLTPSLSARLEWERFFRVGDAATAGRSDIDFGSLGLQYRF